MIRTLNRSLAGALTLSLLLAAAPAVLADSHDLDTEDVAAAEAFESVRASGGDVRELTRLPVEQPAAVCINRWQRAAPDRRRFPAE